MKVSASALLAVLLLVLLAYPWFGNSELGPAFFVGTTFVIFVGGLIEMRNERRWLVPALALAIPTGILSVLEAVRLGHGYLLLFLLRAAFYGLLALNLIAFALRPGKVDGNKLAATINGYLMLGFTFADLYRAIEVLRPNSFSSNISTALHSVDFVYFSFVTLTTVGYGDVAPLSDHARSLAIVQAIVGSLYMVVLVSRMVSTLGQETHLKRGPAQRTKDPTPD